MVERANGRVHDAGMPTIDGFKAIEPNDRRPVSIAGGSAAEEAFATPPGLPLGLESKSM